MWEVRAADGQLEPLLAWLLPRLAEGAQVYRSAAGPPRVVVLDPAGEAADRLAGVPSELIARPAHAWQFEAVETGQAVETDRAVETGQAVEATVERGRRI